ncbi:DNA-directed RNA polymerase I subunit RPA43 [Aspergillus ruber CBS 135680]|uniref:DNA-directed RNA polymerase subunit n=1 Tax=Aspergillus ruber (strain CBS 135680) TaxID=1388766 RepID=A0A017SDS7_ASPRC|nr:uncharacterized protein EURHEDRAFT_412793 [Aspergillus ruber CBS 135680]EYE94941.1 hypothetical protein EURHEDRAFT_412793 [Aspergillus ruber CBS 135680]
MAADAMDLDSNPPTTIDLPERKRKHKSQDSTSTKKRKSDEKKSKSKSASSSKSKNAGTKQTQTIPDSPYSLITATLYLPLSPISISPTHALASLLAEHLSPLLLTYYPPLKGIVLAYSNASISSTPPSTSSAQSQDPSPQPLTLATSANEYGVLYVYLTATFLVFRPQRGQILEGWVNVQSEGFLGAVVLNLFSVGIERKRLPTTWKWIPPGEEAPTANKTDDESDTDSAAKDFDPEKEHFTPVSLASDANPLSETTPNPVPEGQEEGEDESAEGYFQSVSGHRVRGTVRFRVLDVDVIPGTDRERGFMSIEGSMLSREEEERVVEDEKNGILSTATPRRPAASAITMSGALPIAPATATVTVDEPKVEEQEQEQEQEPEPAVETPSKPKGKKSKSDDKETNEKKEKKSKSKSDDKEKKEKKSKSKKVKEEK